MASATVVLPERALGVKPVPHRVACVLYLQPGDMPLKGIHPEVPCLRTMMAGRCKENSKFLSSPFLDQGLGSDGPQQ